MVDDACRPVGGLYEHWYGTSDLEGALRYWAQLGFHEVARGRLDAATASRVHGHASGLASVRLQHRSGSTQGLVRVFAWDRPAGPGLGFAHALATGSRWSGFYTRDLVQVQDAYRDEAAATGVRWKVSPLARLFISDAKPGFHRPFVGIRESTVIGAEHRHAFLQRVGFERPGFGSFAPDTPLAVTECTHGNIVLPDFAHHAFFEAGLGLAVQAPPVRIDWSTEAVRHSMELREDEAFRVVVYQTPGVPTGFLRAYACDSPREDLNELSRPGQLGNCGGSWRYPPGSLPRLRERLAAAGARRIGEVATDEFGDAALWCVAPGGASWSFVA